MRVEGITHHPFIRLCFVALVIFFNIYFGIIIFENYSYDTGVVERVLGAITVLITIQGIILILIVYNVISDIWKWIWKYEV